MLRPAHSVCRFVQAIILVCVLIALCSDQVAESVSACKPSSLCVLVALCSEKLAVCPCLEVLMLVRRGCFSWQSICLSPSFYVRVSRLPCVNISSQSLPLCASHSLCESRLPCVWISQQCLWLPASLCVNASWLHWAQVSSQRQPLQSIYFCASCCFVLRLAWRICACLQALMFVCIG